MNQVGLPHEFIANAIQTAFEFEGVRNLLKMRVEETEAKECDEVVGQRRSEVNVVRNVLK